MREEDKHSLQEIENGMYTCPRCSLTWKQSPSGKCPGVKVYSYSAIPWDTLATYTQLKRQKLKPANVEQADGCYFRLKGKEYIYLYRIDQAQPRRTPTEAQHKAIEKMREALKTSYTCERCGWYDRTHGKHTRYRGIRILKEGKQDHQYCYECWDYLVWVYDRHVIEHNMRVWLEHEDRKWLVLDTETTGLPDDEHFQIVEVAAVDPRGAVVFHSLVKPDIQMPAAAIRIHGLTDADLADAPSFVQVWPRLAELLQQYEVWTYNVAFDYAAIVDSAERFKLDIPLQVTDSTRWHCLMLKFARYHGEYSTYHERDKWQDLQTACYELEVKANGYHRATADALNALRVMQVLAKRGGTFPAPEERPIGGYYGGDY